MPGNSWARSTDRFARQPTPTSAGSQVRPGPRTPYPTPSPVHRLGWGQEHNPILPARYRMGQMRFESSRLASLAERPLPQVRTLDKSNQLTYCSGGRWLWSGHCAPPSSSGRCPSLELELGVLRTLIPGRPELVSRPARSTRGSMARRHEWLWEYENWDPELEGQREALCTLGNGYFATRGRIRKRPGRACIIRASMWLRCATGCGPRWRAEWSRT